LNQSSAAASAGSQTGYAYAASLNTALQKAISDAQTTASRINSILSSAGSGTGSGKTKYASGGFTYGPSIAGEDPSYPTEAVISFNPAYRDANIGYLYQAARMLGVGSGAETAQSSVSGAIFAAQGTSGNTSVQVVFQIPQGTSENVVAQLQNYGEEFAERVREVVMQAEADRERTGYY